MKKLLIAIPVLFLLLFLSVLPKAQTTLAAGTYSCAWTGIQCYTDVANSTCSANWGHCGIDSVGCTRCEDITTEDACTGSNPRPCIEQNPSTGYYCAGTSVGCQPCFDWSTNPECKPPQYNNNASCNSACTGKVPIKFDCVSGQCVESGSGPYTSFGDCTASCQATGGGVNQWCAGPAGEKLNSAIGCIPILTDGGENALLGWILQWAIGIGGGIAFLLIVYAGFMIMTSTGSPDRLQAGKELLTSALAGVILLIFSIFLLKLIGVDILKLPGFGKQ